MQSNGTLQVTLKHRYGNKLFQYLTARIFAENHKLNLISSIDLDKFQFSVPTVYGNPPKHLNSYTITDSDYICDFTKINYFGPGHYKFNGLFQHEEFFYKHKKLVSSYLLGDHHSHDRCVLHIRLGDYLNNKRSCVISIDYYIHCVQKYCTDFQTIYIVHDQITKNWERNYLNCLSNQLKDIGKQAKFISNSPKIDLEFIRSSKMILTSNSTFCFWATFFAQNSKIICFPYTGVNLMSDHTIKYWKNKPSIYQYENAPENIISEKCYSNNISDFFEKVLIK